MRRSERMQEGRRVGGAVSCVISIGKIDGDCNRIRTLGSMYFRIGPKRVFKLVKPSNTKGAALFHVLAALILTSRKGTRIYKRSIIGGCGRVHQRTKCVPKHFSLCRSLSMRRGLAFFTALFGAAVQRGCTLMGSVCRRVRPFGRQHTKGLSNNVGRGLTLDYTLVREPSVLFLSRPAANISPMSEGRF